MTTLAQWLEAHGAHHDVVEWARAYGDDWARAWNECPRGDWLLGLAARRGVDRAELVRAACECAELALEYVADDEARPREALDAARRWLSGAGDEGIQAAKRAVEAAIDEAPDPAVAAAATAAFAALSSIDAPDEAATTAAAVVQAAVLDAGDCAMMSAMRYAQHECAERVRRHVRFGPPEGE